MILLKAARYFTKDEARAAAREKYPSKGDKIEFLSDRMTDKGPSSGEITETKITVDGLYVKIRHSDEERLFSWDDLQPHATRKGNRWMIKAIAMDYFRRIDDPTPEQLKSGDYPKKKRKWRSLTVALENEEGSVRRGTNRSGEDWEVRMKFAYGEIMDTEGVDGDPVDCFIGPDPDAEFVYIVHARKYGKWDRYDEDKCMLDFSSEDDAKAAFLSCYNDPRFLGPVTTMPVDEFISKAKATKRKPQMIKTLFLKAAKFKYFSGDEEVFDPTDMPNNLFRDRFGETPAKSSDGFSKRVGFARDTHSSLRMKYEGARPITRAIAYSLNPSKHKCGARCRHAKGSSCECECGGKNHGAGG